MSADEQKAIGRVEQRVEDIDKTLNKFIEKMETWKDTVDAERNRAKGAILMVGLLGGACGGLLGWIGKNIRL